eukprot:gene7329-8534_t
MEDKIAVLLGGTSAEREVSLRSGASVTEALRSEGFDAHALDTKTYPVQRLKEDGFTKVFIALHGRGGEDGQIQGMLEVLGLPYTGSGVMASALSMDKWRTKMVWQACGLPVGAFVAVQRDAYASERESLLEKVAGLGLPLMVKPSCEGSSVGTTKVKDLANLDAAIAEAFRYDDVVLVEEWLAGPEYTVSIVGDQVHPSIRIEPEGEYYDYDSKYNSNKTKYHCPSGLDSSQESEIGSLAMRGYRALGCRGWGRVDVLQDAQGRFYLLEVNSAPGMTSKSLVPMSTKQSGLIYSKLVVKVLDLAKCN